MNNTEFQVCKRCVMDTTDPDIVFDENGFCNHCNDYFDNIVKHTYKGESSDKELAAIIDKIKRDGKNSKYDCVIGVSGGVDSSYVAYLAKQKGLRILAVHMDNGWDSEESVKNVRNIIQKLEIDYQSYVLDWEEFKDLQLSFLKASVPEIETPTDMAIPAALHKIAAENKIKYIISGGNYATEGILPKSWQYNGKDLKYLKAIHKQFGTRKLKNFPTFGHWSEIYYKFFKGIKMIYILNYVPYAKDKAVKILETELDWKYYGGKHYESRITAFVQGYIYPVKFNYDYRKATFSSLICEKQVTREEAFNELKKLPYNKETIEQDKQYIAKKFGLSLSELETYISQDAKTYRDYPNDEKKLAFIYNLYRRLFNKPKINTSVGGKYHQNCLICNSKRIKVLNGYEKDSLVRCQDCNFVFSQKIPKHEELVKYYEDTYTRDDYLSPITIKRYNEVLDQFEKYKKTNKLLDLGSGVGYFLEAAKQRGWEVYGTEFTDDAMTICKNKGAIMHQGPLDRTNYKKEMFDIITSFEVIEHINNPKEELPIYKEILRKGGVLYFTTPNFNSLERYILKGNYSAIKYPEHLSYYTKKTINILFRNNGFKKIKLEAIGFSLSRIRHSLKHQGNFKITESYDDEKIRRRFETNKLLRFSKKFINATLNLFSIGNSLKGLYVKE